MKFPCCIQPLVKGVMAEATLDRKGTIFSCESRLITSMPHILNELVGFNPSLGTLVGVLTNPRLTKSQIESLVYQDHVPQDARLIEFHVFDTGDSVVFEERARTLLFIKGMEDTYPNEYIRIVNTGLIDNKEELPGMLDQCIEAGYEGIVLIPIDAINERVIIRSQLDIDLMT